MATGAHREPCVTKSKEDRSLENEKYLKEQELESQSNTGNIHNGTFGLICSPKVTVLCS